MTSIDEKQDDEVSASLMSTDLLSLPVNSRKRRRSVLKESERPCQETAKGTEDGGKATGPD